MKLRDEEVIVEADEFEGKTKEELLAECRAFDVSRKIITLSDKKIVRPPKNYKGKVTKLY